MDSANKKIGEVNPVLVKRFLRHLVLASRRINEREKARQQLKKHIDKIKRVSVNKPELLDRELSGLSAKINKLLDAEYNLLNLRRKDARTIVQLDSKVRELESMLISKTEKNYRSLARIEESFKRLQLYLEKQERLRKEREQRMQELEEKIQQRILQRNNEIAKIEHKLDELERVYSRLKIHPELRERAAQIAEKIKLNRSRLNMLKKSSPSATLIAEDKTAKDKTRKKISHTSAKPIKQPKKK